MMHRKCSKHLRVLSIPVRKLKALDMPPRFTLGSPTTHVRFLTKCHYTVRICRTGGASASKPNEN